MQITIKTPDMTKCVNVEGSSDPLLDLIQPEGQAFSDYIESVDLNPYPAGSDDYARYDLAMAKMFKWSNAK